VVDVSGELARFTGSEALAWAGDSPLSLEDVVLSTQGNILTGPEVLDAMQAAAPAGCDLADRLMLALEAPGAAGIGDSRCTPYGFPARSAVLFVDPPDAPAGTYLGLSFEAPDPTMEPSTDPVAALRSQYDAWRADHPCPTPPPPPPPAPTPASCACAAPHAGPSRGWGAALAVALWVLRRTLRDRRSGPIQART